jgi:hypothetical protein
MITSFIIHYLGLQSARGLLGPLVPSGDYPSLLLRKIFRAPGHTDATQSDNSQKPYLGSRGFVCGHMNGVSKTADCVKARGCLEIPIHRVDDALCKDLRRPSER